MREDKIKYDRNFIIGAGVGRTGTFSLKTALEKLNKGLCYHGYLVTLEDHSDNWYKLLNKEKVEFEQIFEKFNATTDFPAAFFWEDIVKAYPNSKVILTIRDSDDWYNSIIGTFLLINLYLPFGIQIYNLFDSNYRRFCRMTKKLWSDFFNTGLTKEDIIKRYNEHNQNVINKVPKERLLVLNVKDGWEPLCKFLEVKIPSEPFPKLNDKDDINKIITNTNRKGYLYLFGLTALSALAFISFRFLFKKYYKK